jgi:beta-lactamase superfamily II metal-dependent hydrolase
MRAPAALLVAALGAAGCAPSLVIDDVTPQPVAPGGTLTLTGRGFDDEMQLSLAGPGVSVTLQGVEVADPTRASAVVPAATPSGTYDLVVDRGDALFTLADVKVVTSGLRVFFLDIGQGDGTLVVAPGGEALLIDGGPVDAGGVVKTALRDLAGGRLDAAVLSHTDADHLGGFVAALAGADGQPGTGDDLVPDQRFTYIDDGSCDSGLCGRARQLRAWPLAVPSPGEPIALGDADVTIVATDGDVGDGKIAGTDNDNERSVVVRVAFGGRSVLITGDLTGGGDGNANVEGPLADKTGPIDVVRVSHHGSDTSSNAGALAAWQPRALVMSLGTDNAYCHPAPDALARIAAVGAPIYATGAGIVDDGDRCGGPTAWPAQAKRGLGTITLEIGADGRMLLNGDDI